MRRQVAIAQARQALLSLPVIRWREPQSEEQARQRLHDVAASIDRALGRVRAGSDEARVLKYAQAWLTAWLQGWEDPALLPPAHAAPMYQRLVDAMRAASNRLAPERDADPPQDPGEPVPGS